MEGRRKTQWCTYCCQELSHAAFYRHLEDKSGCVCPGRRNKPLDSSSDSDSSFDLNTEESSTAEMDTDQPLDESYGSHSSEEGDNSEMDDVEFEGEEIWESSDDEVQPEVNKSTFVAQRILNGYSFVPDKVSTCV